MNLILTNCIKDIYDKGIFDQINSVGDIQKVIEDNRNYLKNKFNQCIGNNKKASLTKIFENNSNRFAGDVFEIFSIGYCILRGKTDSSLLLENVRSVDIEGVDTGVDAYATTTDKKLLSCDRNNINIQIKYTSDRNKKYGLNELSTFLSTSKRDIDKAAKYYSNCIFINFGSGLSYIAEQAISENDYNGISGKLRVISRNHFEKELKNPGSFFDDLRELIKKSVEYIESKTTNDLKFDERDFQKEVISKTTELLEKDNKATIVVPTGGGKTVIATKLTEQCFLNGGTIAIYHAPTLLLVEQTMKTLKLFYGNECDYMRICSDMERSESTIDENITLFSENIKAQLLSSILFDRKLIIVVTYRSYKKLYDVMKSLNISSDISIFDEAHHIIHGSNSSTSDNNWKTFKQIQDDNLCDNMVMFTATPYFDPTIKKDGYAYCPSKYFPESLKETGSMNNIFRFGEIVSVPTARLLDEGYILPTQLKFMSSSEKISGLDKKCVSNIIKHVCDKIDEANITLETKIKRPTIDEVYMVLYVMDYLHKEVTKYDKNNKVKLIYPTNSTSVAHALNLILTKVIAMAEKTDKDIFKEEIYIDSMSSDNAQMVEYSKNKTRDAIIAEMEKDKHCIIIHYDMLSEGVDIPSVTGILLGRNMNETKTIQTNGRAVRLDKDDMKLVNTAHKNGEIHKFSPRHKTFRENNMKKPYSYFIIQVSGEVESQLHQIRDYFKIYNGTTDFAYGEVSYSSFGSTNEQEKVKYVSDTINKEIDGLLQSIPNYIFETEEYSTYLVGEPVDDKKDYSNEVIPSDVIDIRSIDDIDMKTLMQKGSITIDPCSYGYYGTDCVQMVTYFSKEYPYIKSCVIFEDDKLFIELSIKK